MHNIYQKLSAVRSLEETFERIGEDIPKLDDHIPLSEPLAEGRYRRSPRKTRTHKTTSTQRRVWRRAKKRPGSKAKARKRLRKPMVKKRSKLLMQWRNRRSIPQRPAGRGGRVRLTLVTGTDRVANLFEEVQELVTGIEKTNQEEMIRSYANAALIADKLSSDFLEMAEAISSEIKDRDATEDESDAIQGLAGLSEEFEGLAEEAAQCAEKLQECVEQKVFAEEVNEDEVEEHFKELLRAVLDGCEIRESLTEEDEDDDEDEDDMKSKSKEKCDDKEKKKEESAGEARSQA